MHHSIEIPIPMYTITTEWPTNSILTIFGVRKLGVYLLVLGASEVPEEGRRLVDPGSVQDTAASCTLRARSFSYSLPACPGYIC